MLRAALAAGQAVGTLVDAAGLHSPRVTAAVRGLVELLPWEPTRRAALCALSCRNGALNRLLDLVRVRSPFSILAVVPLLCPCLVSSRDWQLVPSTLESDIARALMAEQSR